MTRRVKRIERLVRLAAAEELKARRAMGAAVAQLDQASARLDELERYRREYAAARQQRGQVSALLLRDHHAFLERLDRAASGQRQVIREHDHNIEARRQRWIACRRRVQSLEAVLTRLSRTERQAALRLEQKATDEMSNRSAGRDGFS